MLIIAGKATILTILTIIAVAICVIVIAAASVSCNVARKATPVYEGPKETNMKGEHTKEG